MFISNMNPLDASILQRNHNISLQALFNAKVTKKDASTPLPQALVGFTPNITISPIKTSNTTSAIEVNQTPKLRKSFIRKSGNLFSLEDEPSNRKDETTEALSYSVMEVSLQKEGNEKSKLDDSNCTTGEGNTSSRFLMQNCINLRNRTISRSISSTLSTSSCSKSKDRQSCPESSRGKLSKESMDVESTVASSLELLENESSEQLLEKEFSKEKPSRNLQSSQSPGEINTKELLILYGAFSSSVQYLSHFRSFHVITT